MSPLRCVKDEHPEAEFHWQPASQPETLWPSKLADCLAYQALVTFLTGHSGITVGHKIYLKKPGQSSSFKRVNYVENESTCIHKYPLIESIKTFDVGHYSTMGHDRQLKNKLHPSIRLREAEMALKNCPGCCLIHLYSIIWNLKYGPTQAYVLYCGIVMVLSWGLVLECVLFLTWSMTSLLSTWSGSLLPLGLIQRTKWGLAANIFSISTAKEC